MKMIMTVNSASGKMIPSLQSMDQGEKVIYLGTFSKSLIPSIRISYMVLPHRLMERYRERFSYSHCTVSRIDQHILVQFMKEGDFERHLNRMRNVYRRKLEKTMDILRQYAGKLTVFEVNSGFHVVIEVNNGMDEQELTERARKRSIRIYPLSYYSLENKEEFPPKFILGFAGIPEDELETAIRTLLQIWNI